jgi:hypothetical protein
MHPGLPLEVSRGYCFVSTDFSQRGKPVNRDDTLKRLAQFKASQPYVSAGNAFAIGSIGATIVGTSTLVVGLLGSDGTHGGIKMSDGTKAALIGTGIGVGVLSWVLCITSDGKYASAAEVYNKHLGLSASEPSDDEDSGDHDSSKRRPSANTSVVREPGDDGDYRAPDSTESSAPSPASSGKPLLTDPRNKSVVSAPP